ncbi:DnaJ domain-containing protein [Xanthomonadaceae bacterium JHOS43]|nr:DnaJ domain-containing protein [Xanthomonadaceae bacterium JHOS43]
MQFKDYYEVLGVAPDADEKAIKSAYRRLARKFHPDVSKEPDAEERFKAANEAHEVLGDPARRAEYDRVRAGGWRPGDNFEPSGWGVRGQGSEGFGESGFSDFFESLFGARAQGGTGAGRGPRAPMEVRAHLDVDLETVFSGGKRRVDVNGRTLEIAIPAGIAAGRSIRLKGQGGQGRDLLIEIGYRPHPVYSLDGRDVIVQRRIAPWEAALGATLEVPTLAGPVNLNVPAGSDTGRRLRLRGRGMPGQPPGDQFVVLEVQAPTPTDEVQRRAYRELAQAFGGNVAAS